MSVAAHALSDLLAQKGVLLADGATGTSLFAMGLEAGEAPEIWNETKPDNITKLHQTSWMPVPTSFSPIPLAAHATG